MCLRLATCHSCQASTARRSARRRREDTRTQRRCRRPAPPSRRYKNGPGGTRYPPPRCSLRDSNCPARMCTRRRTTLRCSWRRPLTSPSYPRRMPTPPQMTSVGGTTSQHRCGAASMFRSDTQNKGATPHAPCPPHTHTCTQPARRYHRGSSCRGCTRRPRRWSSMLGSRSPKSKCTRRHQQPRRDKNCPRCS